MNTAQTISINKEQSKHVIYDVPQGTTKGYMLFSFYNLIYPYLRQIEIHSLDVYANDT